MIRECLEKTMDGAVATLWLNRPAKHNAFDADLVAALAEAWHELDADPAVRVIVLAGRGKSFCAGADLDGMRRAASLGVDENLADARALARMLRGLAELRKPTLARVHGAALGGGLGLVAACDIAIAASSAVFATSEVRLGIVPAAISPYVLRAIGARQALRYFQTGERMAAPRACELGLVHEVVAAERLDARVAEIAAELVAGGPLAQAAAKELIRAIAHRPINDTLVDDCAHRIAHLRATPEAREGIGAFLEKRRPSWMGD